MTMNHLTGYHFNRQLAAFLGQETEIELRDGEVLHGVPMEITYPQNSAAHLLFEAAHGEYLCLDLNDIGAVRKFASSSTIAAPMAAF
jgi:hypothetical protein